MAVAGPKERCHTCGDLKPIPTPETTITASGGFCVPVEMLYDYQPPRRPCGACMAANALGVPRWAMDAVTSVPRGGITYSKGS